MARARIPARSVRIPDDVWRAARARADRDGTTVSAVILRALLRYAADDLEDYARGTTRRKESRP